VGKSGTVQSLFHHEKRYIYEPVQWKQNV